MVLKLYTNSQSTSGRLVAAILHEKQVPYELIDANWTGIKEEKWLEKQPFGQMPYIDDDGFIFYESRAIARYIATKYASQGTPLLPNETDVKTMALLEQAISVELSNFDTPVVGLLTEKVFNLWRGLQTNPTLVSHYETTLRDRMPGFERIFSKQKYMAGDTLTFVDFFYCAHGVMLAPINYEHFTNETKYPNVARWFKEITSRDSWKVAHLPCQPLFGFGSQGSGWLFDSVTGNSISLR